MEKAKNVEEIGFTGGVRTNKKNALLEICRSM